MKRSKALPADAEALMAFEPRLAEHHEIWTARGYQMTSCRLWARKDGSWTARIVWRNRRDIVDGIAFTMRGLGALWGGA